MPSPRGPNDIGGLLLIGTGAPDGTGAMLTYAFPRGALPRQAKLAARIVPSDRPLAAHVRITARHSDGSARLALISLASPMLPAGQYAGILLARGAG